MNYFEAIAIKDHKAIHPSQLSFKKGETILVFETAPTGWWRGELFGKKGLFPQSFVVYNKEQYGENPLGNNNSNASTSNSSSSSPGIIPTTNTNSQTSSPTIVNSNVNHHHHQQNNTPIVVTTSTTSNVHSNNSIGSSPHSAASIIDSIEDDFDEIDRIIQSTSPHASSPPQLKRNNAPPPRQIYNTISPNSPMLSAKPDPSIKLSPRFNITRDQIVDSLQGLNNATKLSNSNSSSSSNNSTSTTTKTAANTHIRKTSSPPGAISETQPNTTQPDESHLSSKSTNNAFLNINNIHNHSSSSLGNSSNEIGRLETNVTDSSSSSSNDTRYRTLPSASAAAMKVRKPISNILNNRTTGKISINDVNTDTPYYIGRAVLPYAKQAYDELAINTDDLIVVYNSRDIEGDWWVGKLKNVFGVFPKTCIEIISEIQRSSKDSTPTQSSPSLQSQQQQQTPPNKTPTMTPLKNINSNSTPTTPIVAAAAAGTTTTTPTITPEEQAIAAKIEASFSQFKTMEDMLEAVKNLAVKFVRQTSTLKQELEQERLKYEQEKTLRAAFERELMIIKNQK